jgi:uncharacterized protein YggE
VYGESDGRGRGEVTGYSVSNTVVVRTKELGIAGKIVQASVKAGVNSIGGVKFGLSGDQGREEAIAAAAKRAREDAAALAAASGVRLGAVRRVEMSGQGRPIPYAMNVEFARAGGGEPTLTPGMIPVSVVVSMEYAIDQ